MNVDQSKMYHVTAEYSDFYTISFWETWMLNFNYFKLVFNMYMYVIDKGEAMFDTLWRGDKGRGG